MVDFRSEYIGGAFHSSLSKGKATGKVRITNSGLEFEHEGNSLQLSFDRIEVKRGGAADRLIFFRDPRAPDLSIYTSDDSILNNAVFKSRAHLLLQVQNLKRKTLKLWIVGIGVVLALVALVVGAFQFKDPMVVAVADKVPIAWEEKLGDVVFNQIVGGRRIFHDEALTENLQVITSQLLNAIPDTEYNFRFHIIEDSQINAFAMPGGNVVIHTGLLLKVATPEEIAGVLAHEIAHVTNKHSVRQLISTAGVYVILQSLIGDISGLLAVLAENGTLLMSRQFSRQHETEADETGWEILLDARINPEGMVEFFKRLKAIEESREDSDLEKVLNQSLTFLSTHPATEARIKNLSQKLKTLQSTENFVTFDFNFKTFQEHLRSLLSNTETADQPKESPTNEH